MEQENLIGPKLCIVDNGAVHEGIVAYLPAFKKYGFIMSGSGDNYFFHETDLLDSDFCDLRTGMKARFKLIETHKGLKAIAITLSEETGGEE